MSETITAGHNAGARKDRINYVVGRLADLEGKRKSIGEEIRSLKQTVIKGELGFKIGDFNAAYRLYSLEDEARSQFLDTVRESFAALGIGDQMNWLDATKAPQSAPTEVKKRGRPPKAISGSMVLEAHKSGYQNALNGIPMTEVPEFVRGNSVLCKSFDEGYKIGYEERHPPAATIETDNTDKEEPSEEMIDDEFGDEDLPR